MNNTDEALIDYGMIFFPIRTQVILSYHSFNITQILIFMYIQYINTITDSSNENLLIDYNLNFCN